MLLHDLRFDAEGRERPDFPLNRPAWRDARIIVGARNFGCGSSREAAVYALYDHGIRCVIAPSFGDIFAGNAAQNGLLTAIVADDAAAALTRALDETPDAAGHGRSRAADDRVRRRNLHFTIDPVRRTRLLNGWDDSRSPRAMRPDRGVQGGRSRAAAVGEAGRAGVADGGSATRPERHLRSSSRPKGKVASTGAVGMPAASSTRAVQ